MGFSTEAIHFAQEPDELTGSVISPIYLTSTFAYESLEKNKGYVYSRASNPTRKILESNIAKLEKGKFGFAFSSGMAAITTLMLLLESNSHCIVSQDVYGGTFRLFEYVLKNFQIYFTYVDTTKVDNIIKEIKKETRMVFIETPSNPLLNVSDIAAISEICKENNLLLVVDNTFMSPYFQNPLMLGADIVVHSTTKYINGHSDSLGGILICKDDKIAERLSFLQKSSGAILSPFEAWLILRGIKTLSLRMEKHQSNAMKVASYLRSHSKVVKVYYPGFEDSEGFAIMKKQCSGFGGMVSFELESYEKAKNFLNNLKLCLLAESLGGVETLICLPASMTHASIPEDIRNKIGITPRVIRISVGCEDDEDIINDIEQALAKV